MNNHLQDNGRKIVILFLIDFLASRYGMMGGTERQLIDKVAMLDKSKFVPIVFCLQKRFHSQVMDEIECEHEVLHIYSLKSLKNIYKFIKLWKFMKNRNVDIIETIFFDSILIGVVLAKFAKVPHIISCRRDMGFWYSDFLIKILKKLNSFTQCVVVNSQAVKLFITDHEGIASEKIDVIYNGINLNKINLIGKLNLFKEFPLINPGDKIVGIVANFNRQVKRLDLFIKALAELVKQEVKVKFIVVGDGKLKPELVELAQKLGVADYLVWAGRQDSPMSYVKSFNVGVICSNSEGFCNAILEYMAAGLPVVATDTGGNSELVEDGHSGFLVPINDHLTLAEKIAQLLKDEELAFKMGERGRRIVQERYAWDEKIKEFENYYLSLIRNGQ